MIEALHLIEPQKLIRSTEPPLFYSPCYVSVKKFKKIAKRGCIYFLNFELKKYAII